MENKYFTPKIGDLFVGYECEVRMSKRFPWEKECIEDWFTDRDGYGAYEFEYNLKEGDLRTPYLTPEQIEAEGWKLDEDKKYLYCFEKHFYYNTYSLTFTPKTEQSKEFLMIHLFVDGEHEFMYKGTCPSINEFRKIISLLEFD